MGISQENENCKGSCGCESQAQSGPKKADRLTFSKSARLLKKIHYQRLYKVGSRYNGTSVNIDFRQGNALCPRLGITVAKRHGKAHMRNRFKRCVREAFRLLSPQLPKSIEMNVSPKSPLVDIKRDDIMKDLLNVK